MIEDSTRSLDREGMVTGSIAARMDRLPMSRFHRRLTALIGLGMFFDGFDILMVGSILPFLVKDGMATPANFAIFISLTALGLLVGSLLAGFLGDFKGRKVLYQINLLLYGVASILCAFAPNFAWLLVFRTISAVGLGGEIVSGYGMFSEFLPPSKRGFWGAMLGLMTNLGYPVSAAVAAVVIPAFGWRWMFVIAGVPVFFIWWFRRRLPESPRWLERIGQPEKAREVMDKIEQDVIQSTGRPLPAPVEKGQQQVNGKIKVSDLFRGKLIQRTIFASFIWIFATGAQWGFVTFAPTLLVKQGFSAGTSLNLGLLISLGAIPGVIIGSLLADRWGRKRTIVISSILTAILAIVEGTLHTPVAISMIGFILSACIFVFIAVAVGAYVPEMFPTEARLSGNGFATTCARFALIFMPLLVTRLVQSSGAFAVFVFISVCALILALIVAKFGFETKLKSLESIEADLQK